MCRASLHTGHRTRWHNNSALLYLYCTALVIGCWRMTFYIKPPKGNISLSSLYKDAETRLLFLCQLEQCWGDVEEVQRILSQHPNIAANSDCLIEGSHKDRSSHFVLRLTCLGSGQFQSFLIEAESQFFEYRLGCGGKAAVKSTVLTLLRHIKYALTHLELSPPYHELLLQIKEVSSEVLSAEMLNCGTERVCNHSIKVPWILVENLVKGRNVIVTQGKAEVHCECLLQLLCSFFRKTLEYGIKQMAESSDEESFFHDARIVQVKKSLCRLFKRHCSGGSHHVSHAQRFLRHYEVEFQVKFFPLCMQILHRTLVKNSRLRHHARFRYTLFLKDIGMPWQENVAFWEHYYSRPHSGAAAGCCHTWKGNDGPRYTYGIRHLYGMEGGRKNYTSHSCSALQDMKPQPQEPGGCPFTSLDIEDIIFYTPHLHDTPHLQQAIAKEISSGRPSTACKMLLGYAKLMYGVSGGGHKQDPGRCCNDSGKQKQKCDCKSTYSNVPVNCFKKIDTGCISYSKHLQSEKKIGCFKPSGSIEHVLTSSAISSNENICKTNMKYSHVDANEQQLNDHIPPKAVISQCDASIVQENISHLRREVSDALTLERQDEKKGSTTLIGKNVVRISSKGTEMKDNFCAGCENSNMRSDAKSNSLSVESERKICDIEDIRSMLPYCQFSRPSHYYFKEV